MILIKFIKKLLKYVYPLISHIKAKCILENTEHKLISFPQNALMCMYYLYNYLHLHKHKN